MGDHDWRDTAGLHADRLVLAGTPTRDAAQREGVMEQAVNRPSLDVSELPSVGFGTKSITWWGVMGMMAIEGMVFALMIISYFYLSTRSIEWPPHRDPPDLFWGTLNTIVFILSVLPNEWYRRRAPKRDLKAVRIGLVVLTLIGLINIVIRYFELKHMNTDWSID